MDWDKHTEEKFNQLIEKVPVFLRALAKEKVLQKAQSLAKKENQTQVNEKNLVDAFFEETPFGFHGPMKTDMQEIGIDYTQYGYEK
ncbi:MAG: DUF2621 family protein [Candidatus Omnitrophica bacterium]|nr:DUF2621 family protein [Candidatus Omnitrophota bacterium]